MILLEKQQYVSMESNFDLNILIVTLWFGEQSETGFSVCQIWVFKNQQIMVEVNGYIFYNRFEVFENGFDVKGLRFDKKGLSQGPNGFEVKGLAHYQKGFEATGFQV